MLLKKKKNIYLEKIQVQLLLEHQQWNNIHHNQNVEFVRNHYQVHYLVIDIIVIHGKFFILFYFIFGFYFIYFYLFYLFLFYLFFSII